MRVIRFRGKEVSKPHLWVTGNYYEEFGFSFIWPKGKNWPIHVFPSSVGQYIGLNDINGKMVYEGDIVRLHRNEKYTYVVEWREGYAGFVARCQKTGIGLANLNENIEIEVIGNIYANDE